MTTEERLEKLEGQLVATKRRNRHLLVAMTLAAVGVALAWTITASAPHEDARPATGGERVIRANEFIVEDADGKPRAHLYVDQDGPGLVLRDETGKARARLVTLKDGSALALSDADGKARAVLGVTKDGPALSLYDEKGKAEWSAP